MKTDIKNRADIEKIVNAFYVKIKADADISYFFNEVAKVNWEDHLPKMYNFFENISFRIYITAKKGYPNGSFNDLLVFENHFGPSAVM